jgi:hypothetical protein
VYADFYLQLSVFLARMVVLVLELFVVFLVMLVLLFAFLILTLPVSDGSRVRSVVLCEVDNGDIELIDLDRQLLVDDSEFSVLSLTLLPLEGHLRDSFNVPVTILLKLLEILLELFVLDHLLLVLHPEFLEFLF